MTAFEITTVLGVVIGIPVGNLLYGSLGVHGFFGVLAIYLATVFMLGTMVVESRKPAATPSNRRTSGWDGRRSASIAGCYAARGCSPSCRPGSRSMRSSPPSSG